MLQFLIVLGFAALFVVFGVSVSYYLYSRGAIGRAQKAQSLASDLPFDDDDDDDDFRIRTGMLVDATSRYARTAVLFLLGAGVFLALVLVMLLH